MDEKSESLQSFLAAKRSRGQVIEEQKNTPDFRPMTYAHFLVSYQEKLVSYKFFLVSYEFFLVNYEETAKIYH